MPKLPIISGKKLVKTLSKIGFELKRITGSHAILIKEDKEKRKVMVPVPLHKELAKGTLKSIMKQTGINREELLELI